MSVLNETWDAYQEFQPLIHEAFWEHVKLVVVPIAIATAGAVVLGILASRVGRLSFAVISIGNLGRAVPTFAVIGLFLTIYPVGFWPAAVALIALAVPPILLNTFTGIREVDRATIEASRGMGLTPLQILWRVELPIALPLISGGVRTAAVEVVATAALAGLAGGGGLGKVIQSGLDTGNEGVLLAGAIPVAALALLAQALLGAAERLLTPKGLRIARGLSINEGRTA